jgi:hypothetical protein
MRPTVRNFEKAACDSRWCIYHEEILSGEMEGAKVVTTPI